MSGPINGLGLDVRRGVGERLHAQLETQLRRAIRAGRLPGGTRLPPSRVLGAQLGLSRGVVVEAYGQLAAEGYLTAAGRRGTRVSPAIAAQRAPRLHHTPPPVPALDLHPGHPDLSRFPRHAWARAMRAALRTAPDAALGYTDVRGSARLRSVLAAHLVRVRGAVVHPDLLLITTGHQQAVGLVLRALSARGARRVAVEDPGFPWHRAAVAHAGLTALPLPVDAHGADVARLHDLRPDAVIVTPAHQAPTGAALAADRRVALVRWAQRSGALVLEDDYDAEFRYDRDPLGVVQGLAPDHVVCIGSTSKTLAPAMRLGWAVLPPALADAVIGQKALADLGSPMLEQLAFAELLDAGELERHLRRMRPHYRARRDALVDALARHLPGATLLGVPAGLHLVALLPGSVDEAAVIATAAARGVHIHGLGAYRAEPVAAPPGVVLGFGNVPPPSADRGVAELSRGVAAATARAAPDRRPGRAPRPRAGPGALPGRT